MTEFFKPNKVQTLEIITPKVYIEEDISLSGLQIRLEEQVINTHLLFANNIASILPVSTVNTLSSIAPYFVKQNKLTNITPFQFESDILVPLGLVYSDYGTSAAFAAYISGTLLPQIRLNSPTVFSNDYLISKLGWFYFLNTSAVSYSPSTYVAEKLTELYFGKSLETVDGIKGLTKFLWNNYTACSIINNLGLIPAAYVSGSTKYTSGTQQLDKLQTLIDVIYSPLISDEDDTTVKDAFDDYITDSTLLEEVESKGPFYKFLKAISYLYQDIDDQIKQINTLYDIEKCPDRFLPLIAELIGWQLFGHDPNRWRLQLKNAVSIYKAKGTKASLQAAIDAIFTEGFLNLSGDINELYESYVPYLIYYALATESPLLSSFDSWTRTKADSLGVKDYSNQSMDTNIRYAVDYILLDTVKRFNSHFRLGRNQWNLDDPNFIFNYRGRNFKIPPFEEFKYYKDVEPIEDQIDFIADKIACYGVSASFLEPFRDYIKGYTISSSELLHLDNRWLFFYSGLQLPPNHDKLLRQLDKKKYDYVGLWGGKSSHFNLNILASSFTYSKRSTEASSTLVLQEALRAINAFTPAHAIPDINFLLADDDFTNYQEYSVAIVEPQINDFITTSSVLQGYYTTGVNMSSLAHAFKRSAYDSLSDFAISAVSSLSLPRTSQRRRSLRRLLPRAKFYDRTGFNMPTPDFLTSTYANALPLGFIPSALRYAGVGAYSSLTGIYSKCENLNSNSIYSGVYVSNTYPCRGLSSLTNSTSTIYATHGDSDKIYALIYEILYNREIKYWTEYLATSAGYTQYASYYKNMPVSLANSSFSLSSPSQYIDFSFKEGIHRLYKDWTRYFARSNINYASLDLSGGKDIFSHTYGPLIYNAKLDQFGSAINLSGLLVASTFDTYLKINNGNGSGVLSPLGSSLGTYIISGLASNNLNVRNEFRNSSILNAVEIVNTSGASLNNEFTIYDLSPVARKVGYTNYIVDNPVIKMKAINGFPRLIFHFSSVSNILIPEHEFNFKVKYFAGFDSGDKIGGAGIGVWLHTEPENGMIWSWNGSNWEMYTVPSALKLNNINDFFITDFYKVQPVDASNVSGFAGQCYNTQTAQAATVTLENISSSLMRTLNFDFNTSNSLIQIPQVYFKDFKQVHRATQKYVVEVFKLLSPDPNSYILLDEVAIIDETENKRVEEYTPNQLLTALRFFIDIANDRASRYATITSGTFYASGGSRINMRVHPTWCGAVRNSFNQVSAMDFIN